MVGCRMSVVWGWYQVSGVRCLAVIAVPKVPTPELSTRMTPLEESPIQPHGSGNRDQVRPQGPASRWCAGSGDRRAAVSTPRRSRTTSSSTAAASCARRARCYACASSGATRWPRSKGRWRSKATSRCARKCRPASRASSSPSSSSTPSASSRSFRYQKFREVWRVREVEVVIDRTPIGDYFEIEGPLDVIRAMAEELGMNMEQRDSPELCRPLPPAPPHPRRPAGAHGVSAGAVALTGERLLSCSAIQLFRASLLTE